MIDIVDKPKDDLESIHFLRQQIATHMKPEDVPNDTMERCHYAEYVEAIHVLTRACCYLAGWHHPGLKMAFVTAGVHSMRDFGGVDATPLSRPL